MSTSASAAGGRRVNPLVAVAAAVVVVTAAAAIFFGIKWIKASNDDSLGFTKARDDVARAGEQAIITFHTIDYHKAEEGLNRWIGVSTGALKDEVTGRLVASKQAIEQAKIVDTAELLKYADQRPAIAVTELNEREGKALVIAAVKVTVTEEGKQPVPKFMRLQGNMERTDTGWKLSGIGQVPYTPAG